MYLAGHKRPRSITAKCSCRNPGKVANHWTLAESRGLSVAIRPTCIHSLVRRIPQRPARSPERVLRSRAGFSDPAKHIPGKPQSQKVVCHNARAGTRDALGKRIGMGRETKPNIEIVGVVQNSKYGEVKADIRPVLYLPYRQRPVIAANSFYVRTTQDPKQLLSVIRPLIARIDPNLPVEDLQTIGAGWSRCPARHHHVVFRRKPSHPARRGVQSDQGIDLALRPCRRFRRHAWLSWYRWMDRARRGGSSDATGSPL
jgi:hypothetical protein